MNTLLRTSTSPSRFPTPAGPVAMGGRLRQCLRGLAALAVGSAAAVSAVAAEKITYQDHALPLLRQRCGACHNADKKIGGLDVTTYSGIMAGGGSGDVVASGNAAGSYLFRVANHDDEPKMPPDAPPIPEAERQVLRAWIDGGLLETKGSVAVVAAKKVEVAMTGSAAERPAVQPLPAHLPLEPAVRTAALDACSSIATSPWAPLAAVCGQKQVLLYRTDSLDLAGVLPFPEGRPHVVKFSRGGGLVLAGGGIGAAKGRVVVWNLRTGRRIRDLGDEQDVVLAADVSADQRLVALGGPQRVVRIFSLETGSQLHDLTKHTDWIQSISFSPDGVLLASTDRSGGVIVWESATGRDYLTLTGHPSSVTTVAWRDDANMLATGCEDGQIRLFELENGNLVKNWAAHGGGVASIEFTRDGRIVSVGRDKVPKLWKGDGSQERAFEATGDIGLSASFCDESGRFLAGDWTGEIRVLNAADGARLGTLDANPVTIADRITAAERSVNERRPQVEAADKAVAAATARTTAMTQQRDAMAAAKQAAEARHAERQKLCDALSAAADAAAKARVAAEAAAAAIARDVAAAAGEAKTAADAVAAAGDDAARKQAAEAAQAAAEAKKVGIDARHLLAKNEFDRKVAMLADAQGQLGTATTQREQGKAEAEAAATQLAQAEAALAAARQEEQPAAAQAAELKNQLAQVSAAVERWRGEATFQTRYAQLAAALATREDAIRTAEVDLAEAEAKRQADEQARQSQISKQEDYKKRIAALAATIDTFEREVKDLLARIEKRGGELQAGQKAIEQTLQAIAALQESAKSLQKGLATTPNDKDLQSAQAALSGSTQAKQGQLKQQQETLATLNGEKAAWEKSVTDKRASIEQHKTEIAAATTAIGEATKLIEAAAKAVEESGRVVEQKRGIVAERQKEAGTAAAELDALQGVAAK